MNSPQPDLFLGLRVVDLDAPMSLNVRGRNKPIRWRAVYALTENDGVDLGLQALVDRFGWTTISWWRFKNQMNLAGRRSVEAQTFRRCLIHGIPAPDVVVTTNHNLMLEEK